MLFRLMNVCPYHPKAYIIDDYTAGDMICSECGLVFGDRIINLEAEWRIGNEGSADASRVDAAENPLHGNLSTTIVPVSNAKAFDTALKGMPTMTGMPWIIYANTCFLFHFGFREYISKPPQNHQLRSYINCWL